MKKKNKERDRFDDGYLKLCRAVFDDMIRTNSFPWKVDPEIWKKFESRSPSPENITDGDELDAENPYS